jgi:hypothetical protein
MVLFMTAIKRIMATIDPRKTIRIRNVRRSASPLSVDPFLEKEWLMDMAN